jgi:hypothetical protein
LVHLQSNSIAMLDTRDLDAPAGLAGSSLRVPSGATDSYVQFLRGAAGATRVQAPGLKTLSGMLPRMHVVTNSDRSSMDFENNRSFTVRCRACRPVANISVSGMWKPASTFHYSLYAASSVCCTCACGRGLAVTLAELQ